eukprot:TRINITY_DN331_c0_g1_i1.p1 TRINITY_DN331_c0_g1~~TRINITY_DN331_c0_g1_i1.p1  ORF type:complete len:125 (+),score=31.57 TRINITY_DN331_c0_g1_i1:91-465(+)
MAEEEIVVANELDTEHLEDITDNDVEFLNELWELFEEEYEKSTKKLLEAIDNNDSANSKLYSHNIKSCSANLGAINIKETSSKMEQLSNESKLQEVKDLLPQLEIEKGRLSKAWSKHIETLEEE